MSACQGTSDDGTPCSRTVADDKTHCWQHQPDTSKVANPTDKRIDVAEGKAIDVLSDEMATGGGPNARVRAAESVLEHVRWARGQGDE